MYDFLIVGAGLFGAVFAHEAKLAGKRVLVIDRRSHIAGNIYSEEENGIQVHVYGPHIFHTDDREVWDYVRRFSRFNHFRYEPIANYKGELYNLPFNMNTFHRMWGVNTPEEASAIIEKQRGEITGEPENLEQQAISLIGRDLYEKLVKGYTEKQWGRPCTELPSFIIRRLPVRFRYDNNYFDHPYQGIPEDGYTNMVTAMLDGADVRLKTDYLKERDTLCNMAEYIVYTGPIDEYFDYCYGPLAYRSLRFEKKLLDKDNYQGVAGMNFTDTETPYTRIVEHKHFVFKNTSPGKTIITKEYPAEWKPGSEAYYPVNDRENQMLYEKYKLLALQQKNMIFGGRLAEYRYYDMDRVIRAALDLSRKVFSKE